MADDGGKKTERGGIEGKVTPGKNFVLLCMGAAFQLQEERY